MKKIYSQNFIKIYPRFTTHFPGLLRQHGFIRKHTLDRGYNGGKKCSIIRYKNGFLTSILMNAFGRHYMIRIVDEIST